MVPNPQNLTQGYVYQPTVTSTVQNNHCRRRLQSRFDESDTSCDIPVNNNLKSGDRSVLSVLSFNENTRKVIRGGAERVVKTFNSVRTSIGTFSQKFRSITRRRQILEEGPMTPNCALGDTPQVRQVLGRTPTKLYSPFSIETPKHGSNKENRAG